MTDFARMPNGAHGAIEAVAVEIRTLFEFDGNFLRDQLRSELFVGGELSGIYAVMVIGDDEAALMSSPDGRAELLDRYRPVLEQMVIRSFTDQSWRKQTRDLEGEVRELRQKYDSLYEQVNAPGVWRQSWMFAADMWRGLRMLLARKIEP